MTDMFTFWRRCKTHAGVAHDIYLKLRLHTDSSNFDSWARHFAAQRSDAVVADALWLIELKDEMRGARI